MLFEEQLHIACCSICALQFFMYDKAMLQVPIYNYTCTCMCVCLCAFVRLSKLNCLCIYAQTVHIKYVIESCKKYIDMYRN